MAIVDDMEVVIDYHKVLTFITGSKDVPSLCFITKPQIRFENDAGLTLLRAKPILLYTCSAKLAFPRCRKT